MVKFLLSNRSIAEMTDCLNFISNQSFSITKVAFIFYIMPILAKILLRMP